MDKSKLLQEAANFFKIGEIKNIEKTKHGVGNQNYFINTTNGEFVIRILIDQTLEGLENELAIENQLKDSEVITSELLKGMNGKVYFQIDNKNITCSKKIMGKHPSSINNKLSFNIGKVLAIFHVNVTNLPAKSDSWLNRKFVKNQIEKINDSKFKGIISEKFSQSLKLYHLSLPEGIIHGDLHSNNMLITPEGNIAIFDFEACDKDLLIIDVARTVLSICTNDNGFEKSLLNNFLEGYNSIRKMTQLENHNFKSALIYSGCATAASLFNNGEESRARQRIEIINLWK